MKKNILTMAALLMASAAVFTATLNVKWNEGEMVYVLQQDKDNTADWNYVGKLTAAASANATTTLSGTLTVELGESGTNLDTEAPALRFVLHGNALDSSNASDYSTGQNGLLTGTGSIEEKYDFASCDLAKGSYTIDTEAKTVSVTGGITLVSEQAIVKFSLYQADGTTPINATSLAITSTGDMKKGRVYESDATTIITQSVSLTGLKGSTNNLYVALCNYNATAYTLTATDAAGNTYTYGPKTTTFTNGKYYEVKVKMKMHEYVDLGLPSGTKWANMNVGASSETDRGYYFAWAGTTGYAYESGHNFSEENAPYPYGNTYSKYIGSDHTALLAEDDAATANWGGQWRMPTKVEWEELWNNCTAEWKENYKGSGINGILFTSNVTGHTDKSIFLPANGYYYGTDLCYPTINVLYWSSNYDLQKDANNQTYTNYRCAYVFDVSYGNNQFYWRNPSTMWRYRGVAVRPVCP